MTTQIIFTGDTMEIADARNSEIPTWPVQDVGGGWVNEQFAGQRVVFSGAHVHFGLLAIEIDKPAITTDDDGEPVFDGLYVTNDYRIFRAI